MGGSVGIGGMQFKAELQVCLDEDLLMSDKIGIGNFYWKLPGDAANAQAKVCLRSILRSYSVVCQLQQQYKEFENFSHCLIPPD